MDMQWTIPTKLTEPVIDFQKATFNNVFEALEMLQNQAERMTLSLVCSMGIPEEGERLVDEWIKSIKQAREQYKDMIIQGFDDLERFFPQHEQEEAVKEVPKKPAKKVEVKAAETVKKVEPAKKKISEKEQSKSE